MTEHAVAFDALLARVADWPEAPPADVDALQWHYAQALAKRAAKAAPATQQVLAQKLDAALTQLEVGAHSTAPNAAPLQISQAPEASPWAPLNARIAELTEPINTNDDGAAWPSDGKPRALKSAQRFREIWALISAEAEVDLAAFRAPTHAGPLNAHRLVLQVLAQMRDLSPAYLRHCLQQVDTLMWLDQAYAQLQTATAKGGSKPTRKSATTKRKR